MQDFRPGQTYKLKTPIKVIRVGAYLNLSESMEVGVLKYIPEGTEVLIMNLYDLEDNVVTKAQIYSKYMMEDYLVSLSELNEACE